MPSRNYPSSWVLALLLFCSAGEIGAQSTQGLITGQVQTQQGTGLAGAWVLYCRLSPEGILQQKDLARSDLHGFYALPFLTPGTYRLRAQEEDPGAYEGCFPPVTLRSDYQAQEKHDLTLTVAGRLVVDFDLRPAKDVWDSNFALRTPRGMILRFFGADEREMKSMAVDTGPTGELASAATLSYVLDARAIANLPLNGRDLFSALVVLPGVTSDTGTGRGLGLAVNGTRSTASNFLLDGLENNNYLVTGPLTTLAPEAAQEYRISTNNFSAEFGRATGFVANAVSRSGGQQWHGLAYLNLQNEILNANTPENNVQGISRRPLRQAQLGGQAGGPLKKDRLFGSFAFDSFRSRNRRNPSVLDVPSLRWRTTAGNMSTIYGLLSKYPLAGEVRRGIDDFTGKLDVEQPVSADRLLGLTRVDALSRSGTTRAMGRVSISRSTVPDFIWSPYPGFSSEFAQPDLSSAFNLTQLMRGGKANEFRAGWSRNQLGWDRPHPEIPTMSAGVGIRLPGSPAAYEYRNVSRNFEVNDSFQWIRGRHVVKAGGGLLTRSIDSRLTYGRDGQLFFENLLGNLYFAGRPTTIGFAVDRAGLPGFGTRPDYDREYRYRQAQAFVEDTIRLRRRLTLSVGLRYENFGVPRNSGLVKNYVVQPREDLQFLIPPVGADQALLSSNPRNFALRLGISQALGAESRTVLRAAYGVFFDRPFDNLWQNLANNNFRFVTAPYSGAADAYLLPPDLSKYEVTSPLGSPRPLYLDPKWKTGAAHSYFAGVEHRVDASWTLTLSGSGSAGQHLVTSDLIGRPVGANSYTYRGPQGASNYLAMSAMAQRRTRGGALQAAYTWSHSIDNQSDPLAGDLFDLAFTQTQTRAAFSLPGNRRIDRGNSDFDQRHNLVFHAFQELPGHWTVAGLGAVRSGLPFTVITGALGQVFPQRPDLIFPDQVYAGGGPRLNAEAFGFPKAGEQGNLGRNSLAGPGFYSFDVSVGRSFALGDAARLTLRVDAFNVLNHLNLSQPNAVLGEPGKAERKSFGLVTSGRAGAPANFPSLVPLDESPRRLQLIFRLNF